MEKESTHKSHRKNRLSNEKSPYLLQHQYNPVDWYPWGEDAFEKAKAEDKLIFLSVGYSTCHWCHVMERESFESEDIAKIMNGNYVNIKLDREERPDVDKIYMTYVQATTGGGGWPMSVWLTPDLKPIFAGTYFPPRGQYGRPGFADILNMIAAKWKRDKNSLISSSQRVMEILQEHESGKGETGNKNEVGSEFTKMCMKKYVEQNLSSFDKVYGGFGKAPKFPRPVVFTGLYHCYFKDQDPKVLKMCELTLEKMYMGGVHDPIGGGFHRYSVDKFWHVPHFEKMIYDQAQLVPSYLSAYQITKKKIYKKAAIDILDYVLGYMTSDVGGFYSAEDADSIIKGTDKHAEGAFYVWEYDEIQTILNDDYMTKIYCKFYDIRKHGNVADDPHEEFVNKNVLIQRKTTDEIAKELDMLPSELEGYISKINKILLPIRNERPRPFLDDKIITGWNGLMITAFAKGYSCLSNPSYLEAAVNAATFIYNTLYKDGYLIRNYKDGPSNIRAFASDYSYLITGLLDLYEASCDHKWLKWAIELQAKMDELFYDDNSGGYFNIDGRDQNLVLRMKEDYDGAEPSENSYAAMNLVRLYLMTNQTAYREKAIKTLQNYQTSLRDMPVALPHMLGALDWITSSYKQIMIAGDPNDPEAKKIRELINSTFDPLRIIFYVDGKEGQAYLRELGIDIIQEGPMTIDGKVTVYLCEGFQCQAPITDIEQLKRALKIEKNS